MRRRPSVPCDAGEPRGGLKARLRRARTYAQAAAECRRAYDSGPAWFDLARDFWPWCQSFSRDGELRADDLPWLTFPAVRFLDRRLQRRWRVFEYGSGSSTIFLARHCAQVISVEHDGNWATRVQTALDRLSISNCQLRRVVPEPIGTAADTIGYTSGFEGCEQLAFRRYASAIDDQDDHSLDVVLIDGRAREACLRHADRKLRPGGFLIVDNTERPRYRAALERLPSDWLRIDFPGPCAHTDFFTRTTVWILPTHTGD